MSANGIPPLVAEARAAAARLGFEGSSLDEVGRLLATLAASRPAGRIGEVGTGTGVGAAWIASALTGGATLVTVELDEARAAAAASVLAGVPGCTPLHGDWRAVLPPHAPFDLLFLDGAQWKRDPVREAPLAVELLAPGGLLVIDNLTPVELWPEEWRGQPDRAREWLEQNPSLRCVEVRTTAATAAVIAARTA